MVKVPPANSSADSFLVRARLARSKISRAMARMRLGSRLGGRCRRCGGRGGRRGLLRGRRRLGTTAVTTAATTLAIDEGEHIGPRDAAAGTRAFDLVGVEAVLGDQPAHDGRQ